MLIRVCCCLCLLQCRGNPRCGRGSRPCSASLAPMLRGPSRPTRYPARISTFWTWCPVGPQCSTLRAGPACPGLNPRSCPDSSAHTRPRACSLAMALTSRAPMARWYSWRSMAYGWLASPSRLSGPRPGLSVGQWRRLSVPRAQWGLNFWVGKMGTPNIFTVPQMLPPPPPAKTVAPQLCFCGPPPKSVFGTPWVVPWYPQIIWG